MGGSGAADLLGHRFPRSTDGGNRPQGIWAACRSTGFTRREWRTSGIARWNEKVVGEEMIVAADLARSEYRARISVTVLFVSALRLPAVLFEVVDGKVHEGRCQDEIKAELRTGDFAVQSPSSPPGSFGGTDSESNQAEARIARRLDSAILSPG